MATKETFFTIEDTRYTMERAEHEGLITPPKNWQKMTHVELMEFFAEHGIRVHKAKKRVK